uniref:Uncharacterized protein n=1 Tax=Arundo donax TaxID=35708 RepID=A0A0A9GWR6_ARUDO
MCTQWRDPVLPELAVCDLLTRRYTLLPRIPDCLLASTLVQILDEHIECFDAFFVPSGDYNDAQFRVIGWTHCEAMTTVFVYSSVSSCWSVGTSTSWDALGLNVRPEGIPPPSWRPSYACGCFYWKVTLSNKLLKLDINRMEFSVVCLPPGHENWDTVVVEAGE